MKSKLFLLLQVLTLLLALGTFILVGHEVQTNRSARDSSVGAVQDVRTDSWRANDKLLKGASFLLPAGSVALVDAGCEGVCATHVRLVVPDAQGVASEFAGAIEITERAFDGPPQFPAGMSDKTTETINGLTWYVSDFEGGMVTGPGKTYSLSRGQADYTISYEFGDEARAMVVLNSFTFKDAAAFVVPRSGRVELVKTSPDANFGDVYYYYQDGEHEQHILIAPSLSLADGDVTNSFDSIFYNGAVLSPDGRFVALPATCWEETCLRMYDVKTQSLQWVDHAAVNVSWLPDGRLRAEGVCAAPRVEACGPYESISADEPWKMREAR